MKLVASKNINFGGNSLKSGDAIEVQEEVGQHLMIKHPDWFGGTPTTIDSKPQESLPVSPKINQNEKKVSEPLPEKKVEEKPVIPYAYTHEEIRGWSKEHQLAYLKKKGIKPALTEGGRIKQILENQ